MFFVKMLLSVVLVELFTELIVKSEIVKPLRQRIKGINSWFSELFSCGYCMSVWVAFGVAIASGLSYTFTGILPVDLGLTAFILHRLSNYLHNFNDRWLDKYYDPRFVNSQRGDD